MTEGEQKMAGPCSLGENIPINPERGAEIEQHFLDVYESLRERNPTFYWKDMYERERRKHYRLHHPGVDPESTDALHPHAIGCIDAALEAEG